MKAMLALLIVESPVALGQGSPGSENLKVSSLELHDKTDIL